MSWLLRHSVGPQQPVALGRNLANLHTPIETRNCVTGRKMFVRPFLWPDVFTFLYKKLNFSVFFSHEKKISQILENLARKRNTLERKGLAMVATWLKQRESLTQTFLCSPAVRVIQVSLYFIRKTDLCLNWFEVMESCTSVSLTSSPGMTLTQRIRIWIMAKSWNIYNDPPPQTEIQI